METDSGIPGHSFVLKWTKNIFSRTLRASNCVPRHVGFIMDGNRRFARKKEMDVKEGHEAGFVSMSRILELCYEAGVDTATVFAFSIENFKRSSREVESLMTLARERIRQITERGELACKYGVRIKIIGDLSLLDKSLLEDVRVAVETTKNNKRATLNICFPYTGREEILHAMKETIDQHKKGAAIGESTLESHLYTAGVPPLDLLIRTSGVSRLSDFLIWQASSKGVRIELLDCLWPEFGPIRMAWILLKFSFHKSFLNKEYRLEEGDYDEETNGDPIDLKEKKLN